MVGAELAQDGPSPSEQLEGRAKVLARLLTEDNFVVVRRKVRVHLMSSSLHQRFVTSDFVVPPWAKEECEALGLAKIPIPVSLPEKSYGRSFSYDINVSGESSTRLPTSFEISELTPILLSEAATRVAGKNHKLSDECRRALRLLGAYAAMPHLSIAQRSLCLRLINGGIGKFKGDSIARLDTVLLEDPRFVWIAGLLVDRGLVSVELGLDTDEAIVKFSCIDRNNWYEEVNDRLTRSHSEISESWRQVGREPYRLRLRLAAWPVASTHIEVAAPEGSRIVDPKAFVAPTAGREMIEPNSESVAVAQQHALDLSMDENATRAHLYGRELQLGDEINLNIDFSAARSGFVGGARWVVWSAALATISATFVALTRSEGDAAIAILAAIPAIAAPLVLESDSSHLVRALLLGTRRTMMAAALASIVAGLAVVIDRIDIRQSFVGTASEKVFSVDTTDWLFAHIVPVSRVVFFTSLCALVIHAALKIELTKRFPQSFEATRPQFLWWIGQLVDGPSRVVSFLKRKTTRAD